MVAAAFTAASCGRAAAGDSAKGDDSVVMTVADTLAVPAETSAADEAGNEADKALIRSLYEKCVFHKMWDEPDYGWAESHLTDAMVKRLRDAYSYEYDGDGMAFWLFRTDAQDGDGESKVRSVSYDADGWYVAAYSDQGYEGATKIRVEGGRIADCRRLE